MRATIGNIWQEPVNTEGKVLLHTWEDINMQAWFTPDAGFLQIVCGDSGLELSNRKREGMTADEALELAMTM